MRRFYKSRFEDVRIEGGTIYWDCAQISDELLVMREVVSNGGEHVGSNRPDADGFFFLPDGPDSIDNVDPLGEIPVVEIDDAEFEAAWAAHCAAYRERWERAKREYPLGAPVAGKIEIFYPQGTIIGAGDGVFGVAADGPAGMDDYYHYRGHAVTAVVAGYDEDNLWLVLEDLQGVPG